MRIGRRSAILAGLDAGIEKIQDAFSKSRIAAFFSHAGADAEAAFRKGLFRRLSDAESGHGAWQYRFRRACMRNMENSRFLNLYRFFLCKTLQISVFSIGFFVLLYGVFSALLGVAGWIDPQGRQLLYTSVFCVLVAIPLFSSGSSLGQAIRNSFFAKIVLFGWFGVSSEALEECGAGAANNWSALFYALLTAILARWLPLPFLLCLLLGGVLFAILFRTPELITLGILFFLPLFSLLPHAGIFLCAAVLFADVAWLWRAVCGRRRLRFGLIDFTLLFFAFLILLGGILSAGGANSAWESLARFTLLSFWFPCSDFFTQALWRRRGTVALKGSGFLASVMGIGQYFFTDMELFWVDVTRFSDIGGRVCGPFSNPNIFAVFLVLIAPLALVGALDDTRSLRNRFCNAVGFLSMGLCTVFTWSRGAWLGLLLAIFFVLLAYSRASLSALLLSVLPIGMLSTYLPHSVSNRFSSIGSFSESSIRYRFYTWRGVARVIWDYPWGIGVGESAFSAVYPRYALSGIETVMHAHQLILQILLELGVPGVLLLFFFLYQLFLCSFSGLKRLRKGARAELLGGVGGVMGTLVMGCFDYVWYHLGMFCLFFILCSLIAIKRETEESAYEKSLFL